ncbi:16101_t:CDS:1, partial [Cetraspora pellucida]
WQNKRHDTDFTSALHIGSIANPQDCCKNCFDDPECLQWGFTSAPTCYNYKNKPNSTDVCNGLIIDYTGSDLNSGIIRCNDNDN